MHYFEEFTRDESLSSQWTHGTKQIWDAFKKHLEAVVKQQSFDFFNDDGIKAFIRHLRVNANMQENSVQKHYLNLRWFLNWAILHGYATEKEIGKIQPKFKLVDKPIIFLTKEELLKLYNYEVPANGTKVKLHNYAGEEYEKVVHDAGPLAKSRDMFCFCAFTSLRYSDMANLKRTDIVGDTMYITTQKTYDRLPINLNSFAKEILAKYEDQRFPNGAALPVISNQKMNDYLKDLCEFCEFNIPITRVTYRAGKREEITKPKYELIGTHAGRRTFICFALSSSIPHYECIPFPVEVLPQKVQEIVRETHLHQNFPIDYIAPLPALCSSPFLWQRCCHRDADRLEGKAVAVPGHRRRPRHQQDQLF